MTLKELSQLYDLKKEIKQDEKRLETMGEDNVSISSPIISDMPRSGNKVNKIETGTERYEILRGIIQDKKNRCVEEQIRLERYISAIDDSLTRQIFTLRFVEGLSWKNVVIQLGDSNTIDSVKKICYRYIEKN